MARGPNYDRRNSEKLKYSVDTYYSIMVKVSTIGLFHAMYPEAKIKVKQNQKFISDFCPFHSNTPNMLSFAINEEDVYLYCYGCHESGMSISFLINKYSLHDEKQDKALEILSWLCNEPLAPLDSEQQAIYDEIKIGYAYENQYKKDSEEYTRLVTLRFKVYLDKYGWTSEMYDRASKRYGGLRSIEIDSYFKTLKREGLQKEKERDDYFPF